METMAEKKPEAKPDHEGQVKVFNDTVQSLVQIINQMSGVMEDFKYQTRRVVEKHTEKMQALEKEE